MSAERLFIALTLPPAVRAQVEELIDPKLPSLRWTRPEQLHLTLRFLGDVETARIDALEAALAGVRVQPFLLPIEGTGAFPPKGPPRVLWVGIGRGHPHLHQLRQQIDDAILHAAHPLDVRTFAPHITVARGGENAARETARWLERHGNFEAALFRVESFDLFSSELRPAGSVHTLRRRFPLTT